MARRRFGIFRQASGGDEEESAQPEETPEDIPSSEGTPPTETSIIDQPSEGKADEPTPSTAEWKISGTREPSQVPPPETNEFATGDEEESQRVDELGAPAVATPQPPPSPPADDDEGADDESGVAEAPPV